VGALDRAANAFGAGAGSAADRLARLTHQTANVRNGVPTTVKHRHTRIQGTERAPVRNDLLSDRPCKRTALVLLGLEVEDPPASRAIRGRPVVLRTDFHSS